MRFRVRIWDLPPSVRQSCIVIRRYRSIFEPMLRRGMGVERLLLLGVVVVIHHRRVTD